MHHQMNERLERVEQERSSGPGSMAVGIVAAAGAAAGAAAMYFLDPRQGRGRRAQTKDRVAARIRDAGRAAEQARRRAAAEAYGVQQQIKHAGGDANPPENDAVLSQKVMSILFRDPSIPKGDININSEHGVVVLRGTAQTPDQINDIEARVREIDGVQGVSNELHLPNMPDRDWETAAKADWQSR